MAKTQLFSRLDFKSMAVVLILMYISLLVISSVTQTEEYSGFFTKHVINQVKWFIIGWGLFFLFSAYDYRKCREWTWILYIIVLLLLLGLYFTSPVLHVRRWYRIPLIGLTLQPSEFAKLSIIFVLGWLLDKDYWEKKKLVLVLLFFTAIPFLLILRQPDLGSALVLYPIFLVMAYIGKAPKLFIQISSTLGLIAIVFVAMIFSGALSHEAMKPLFLRVLKEYQYERLNPETYHQKASQSAIALGGIYGTGWRKSSFSSQHWLPAAHTDSVFAAYGEEYGFVGVCFLFLLFYLLIYFSFRVSLLAKDKYGKLLAAGLGAYLSMHILMNIMMMTGFLPISGVPLLLITYGGNSILTTMISLGILQSIYTRRFMF